MDCAFAEGTFGGEEVDGAGAEEEDEEVGCELAGAYIELAMKACLAAAIAILLVACTLDAAADVWPDVDTDTASVLF